jgi:dsDNA-binding SOS-regulon protein
MHILVQKASWRIDEAPRTLHNKKQKSSSSFTWKEREKFCELCTTRKRKAPQALHNKKQQQKNFVNFDGKTQKKTS